MTLSITNPRAKAAIAAALLFALGAIAGAAADRWWSARALSGREASPLTTAAMADALDLDTAQQARVRALLSDLEASVAQAALEGPGSLQRAARDARRRLEAELPPDRRERFRDWMSGHHDRMMDHMCSDDMMRDEERMRSRMHRDDWRNRKNRWED